MKRLRDKVDDPTTIVDRLRGIYKNGSGEYPDASPPYPTSLVMQEAAREIERLREELRLEKGYTLTWRNKDERELSRLEWYSLGHPEEKPDHETSLP